MEAGKHTCLLGSCTCTNLHLVSGSNGKFVWASPAGLARPIPNRHPARPGSPSRAALYPLQGAVAVLAGFADEWAPAVVPWKHILEGSALQETFVTVMRLGTVLRGKVISVLRNAEEVDELGKYLPQVSYAEKRTEVYEAKIVSSEDIVTKSMKRLLEARLISLYKTSVDVSAVDYPKLTGRRDLPKQEKCAKIEEPLLAGAMGQRKEGLTERGGVLEDILSNLTRLNQNLSSIDDKLGVALEPEQMQTCTQSRRRESTPGLHGLQGRKATSSGRRASRLSATTVSNKDAKKSSFPKSPISSFIPFDKDPKTKSKSTVKNGGAGKAKSSAPSAAPKAFLSGLEAEKIRRSSTNYRICALRLARKLFEGGKDGKPTPATVSAEATSKMKEIQKLVFDMYSIPTTEQAAAWRDCKKLIEHSFSVEQEKAACPVPKCPKLVKSRGRIQ